jgi:thiamine-monophosphate kinase
LIVAFNLFPLRFVKRAILSMVSEKQNYLSNEQKLIEDIRSKTGTRFIGDDCARLPGNLLVTSDTLVDGTHFILEQNRAKLENLGWKSMAVSLSDIAAMAGHPRYALVAITMPDQLSRQSFSHLYEGLLDCCKHYKTVIVGGDITKGAILSLTTTVIGEVDGNGCLMREGAKVGDVVVVTGHFGASKAGLTVLLHPSKSKGPDHSRWRASLSIHNRPEPRLPEAWALVNQTGSRGALMDTSDGLADALAQIARKSNVGMEIDLSKIPISAETIALANLYGEDVLDWALYGGEDYELVACLSEKTWRAWCSRANIAAPPFQAIGKVTNTNEIELMFADKKGPSLDLRRSFQHRPKL